MKRGKLHRTAKAQGRGRGFDNSKKCDWGKEKLKSLTGFLSANKIYNYNRAGEKEKKKIQKNL